MAGKSDLIERARQEASSFTDQVLGAWASPGLVRRAKKDLEKALPVILAENEKVLRIEVEGCVVTILESIKDSSCSCAAQSICRHILAAVIFLRDDQGAEEQPRTSCEDEILAITDEDLRKWAGKRILNAAMNKAAGGLAIRMDDSANGTIVLADWNVICHWIPGQGLAGMVCSCHSITPCEHRVAAVLAFQASKGKRSFETAVQALSASSGTPRSREAILEAVERVSEDMIVPGLSALSTATEQRLRTLAASAHGVDLPRLSRLLKALAADITLVLKRDAQGSVRNIMSTLSLIESVVVSLKNGNPVAVGEHRSRYFEAGSFSVVGVGARQWRTGSGYAGLTVYFWDTVGEGWLAWSDARPITQGGFDPTRRYLASGPWEGCASPAEASRSLLHLFNVWRNPYGRLSGRSSTRALRLGAADLELVRNTLDDWAQLTDRAAALFGGGLSARKEGQEIVLLRPSVLGPAIFDTARQTLIRHIQDRRGTALPLKVTYEDQTKYGVSFLEQYAASGPTRVLGLLRADSMGLFVEPVAIHEEGKIINLTLDDSFPDSGANDRTLIKIENASNRPSGNLPASSMATGEIGSTDLAEEEEVGEDDNGRFIEESASPLGLLLSGIESELVSLGEQGLCSARETKHLLSLSEKVGSIGLQACERSLKAAVEHLNRSRGAGSENTRAAAHSLLRAHYVCRLTAVNEAVLGVCSYQANY